MEWADWLFNWTTAPGNYYLSSSYPSHTRSTYSNINRYVPSAYPAILCNDWSDQSLWLDTANRFDSIENNWTRKNYFDKEIIRTKWNILSKYRRFRWINVMILSVSVRERNVRGFWSISQRVQPFLEVARRINRLLRMQGVSVDRDILAGR